MRLKVTQHKSKENAAKGQARPQPSTAANRVEPYGIATLLLNLQRTHGNRFVQRVLTMDRKADSEGEATTEFEEAIQHARGSGNALDNRVRTQMELAFGFDFRGVQVHTGAQADALNRSLNARAFTTGQDIFFHQGEYNPDSSSGRRLLAHELTHVVQQAGSSVQRKLIIGQADDRFEQEAEQVSLMVMRQEPQAVSENAEQELVSRQIEEQPTHTQGIRRRTHKDVVQATSWANVLDPKGHVASIYFATNQSNLDDHDREVLQKVFDAYQIQLPSNKVTFWFMGYADYRGAKSYNLSLSLKRAEAVSEYFSKRPPFADSSNYTPAIMPFGEYESPQVGTSSEQLNHYRRVDIIAEPIIREQQPEPKLKPAPEPPAKHWKCRMLVSVGVGIAYGGSIFVLEIVDLTNHLRMYYLYRGGVAAGAPALSVGKSGASSGTDWQEFTTSAPIRIRDFEGPASHTSGALQLKRGPSAEWIHLYGPTIHGADYVYLGWSGFWEEGWNLGAGTDIGPLEPFDGPDKVPPGYK